MRRFAAVGLVALMGSCLTSAVFASPASPYDIPSGTGVRATSTVTGRQISPSAHPGPRASLSPPPGELNVIYGSGHGLSATTVPDQLWTQDSPDVEGTAEPGDRFGLAAAAGDFNADGLADLAIAAPGDSVGSVDSAGAVNVLYGSASGLSATAVLADQLWTQDSPGVNGIPEPFDAFGSALTTATGAPTSPSRHRSRRSARSSARAR